MAAMVADYKIIEAPPNWSDSGIAESIAAGSPDFDRKILMQSMKQAH